MGGCLSSESGSHKYSSANVVSANGELRQYALPITVAGVLQSQSSSTADSFFLCNSDCLNFDDYIPSLGSDEELEASQIYFVLPAAKLQYRLAASDMAALAVKASIAMEQINASNRRRKSKIRISPVLVSDENSQSSYTVNSNYKQINRNSGNKYNASKSAAAASAGLGVSRSGSVKKLARNSSRRAKLAVRSFRLKLNTIYEGSVLLVA